MNKNILTDLGENYQYLQTIANNTLELKKIELSESASVLVGRSILLLIIGCISLFTFFILIITAGVIIYNATGSVLLSLGLIIATSLFSILTIYLTRKAIIYKPITRSIYSTILNITEI